MRFQQTRAWAIVAAALVLLCGGLRGYAFTSRVKSPGTSVSGGVTPVFSFPPVQVVTQSNPADPADILNFDDDGDPRLNELRNSHESLKITFNTNLPGARIIIHTDNTGALANPRYCDDPIKGNDGGGLVGVPTAPDPNRCKLTLPMVWGVLDNNLTYTFQPVPNGYGASNWVFITDLSHVRTFLSAAERNTPLDNIATKFCDPTATHAVSPGNIIDDGLYPQYFGAVGPSLDICSDYALPALIRGKFIFPGDPIPDAQELSKNIAVIAYSIIGTQAKAPDLSTSDSSDSITVTSPVYLPIAADFRTALPGVTYTQTTLQVEIIVQ